MNVAVIGTGYVGLVAGTCLAELGHHVTCVDVDTDKIERLKEGILPIYEPELDKLVPKNIASQHLTFTTDVKSAVEQAEVIFIAVGTPPSEDGSADLIHVTKVAATIGDYINGFKVVVVKSTVPVGTCDKVRGIIASHSKEHFAVISNPEFLREGVAVMDFMRPDRILVGASSKRGFEVMKALYAPLTDKGSRLIRMDIRSAELTKYASNAMLATRISFMNNLALLCEKVGADIEFVRHGMGSDGRIGPAFLRAGIGYGGSCFPKDVKALQKTAEDNGVPLEVLNAVERVNDTQKGWLVEVIKNELGPQLKGMRLAIWGLAFKPETDDMREAPAIRIIEGLVQAGASIVAFDPQAREHAKDAISVPFEIADSAYQAVEGADALVLLTEWKAFAVPLWRRVKKLMRGNMVFDGRNLWEPAKVRAEGFRYRGVGRR